MTETETGDSARTGKDADKNRNELVDQAEEGLKKVRQATVDDNASTGGPVTGDGQPIHSHHLFSQSSNGDTWFLAMDDRQNRYVLHRGNPASGGHETLTPVNVFLNIRPFGPEREALLALLGVGDDTADAHQETYTTSSH
jgi:hypothetical protein